MSDGWVVALALGIAAIITGLPEALRILRVLAEARRARDPSGVWDRDDELPGTDGRQS